MSRNRDEATTIKTTSMQPLPQSNLNVPAFLSKLWKMVNDPATDKLICWSPSGTSFIIQNQAQFWYELLPVYYKHNNMSSFVRQLNMYGFHKQSSLDSTTVDSDKDEIQFYHQYFQKGKPDLLRFIKRKVTGASKANIASENVNTNQSLISSGDFYKVLADIRNLKGKQKNVDNQLLAMKQENGILWRELALLRQKHMKQQQIVNKLIQFLVTIVQPASRIGGLRMKRPYQLMLSESPKKKMKPSNPESVTSDGPIIHELETDILPDELLVDDEDVNAEEVPKETGSEEMLETPTDIAANLFLDSPELVTKEMLDDFLSDSENQPATEEPSEDINQVFLNPTAGDALLSNLMNGNYNAKAIRDAKDTGVAVKKEPETQQSNEKAVATRDFPHTLSRMTSVDDMDNHIESTQNELDQLKELLNGCTTLDANTLLGLFNEESPAYGLSCNQAEGEPKTDATVSGSELTKYNNWIDFSQLFDDSSEEQLQPELMGNANVDEDGSMKTPQIVGSAPVFPTSSKK